MGDKKPIRPKCGYCGKRRKPVKGYNETRMFKYRLCTVKISLDRFYMCHMCQDKAFKLMADAPKELLNGSMYEKRLKS
jgi:hypothetical protein